MRMFKRSQVAAMTKLSGSLTINFATPPVSDISNLGPINTQLGGYRQCINTVVDEYSGKIITCYKNGGDGTILAAVGSIVNNVVTYGTPVTISSGVGSHNGVKMLSLGGGKVLIAYDTDSIGGRAKIGTISGDSITFGAAVQFAAVADYPNHYELAGDLANTVVITYLAAGDNSRAYAIVGTISGTSVSFGTKVSVKPTTGSVLGDGVALAFNAVSNKFVVAYSDGNNSYYGTLRVGTVTGNSISFGTPVIFKSINTGFGTRMSLCSLGATSKLLLQYGNYINDNNQPARAVVVTVQGSTVLLGTDVLAIAGKPVEVRPVYVQHLDKVLITYQDDVALKNYYSIVSIVNDAPVFATSVQYIDTIMDNRNQTSIAYSGQISAAVLSYAKTATLNSLITQTLYGPSLVIPSGYFAGVYPTYATSIDKLKFDTEAITLSTATLSAGRSHLSGISSPIKGYFCGGYSGLGEHKRIDGVSFTNETAFALSNTLTETGDSRSSNVQNSLAGYLGGGSLASSSSSNKIEKLTYSTEVASYVTAVLSYGRYCAVGVSSTLNGYFAGGSGGIGTDKINYSNDTITSNANSLPSGTTQGIGAYSATKGYISLTANTYRALASINFATDSVLSLAGSLSGDRRDMSGSTQSLTKGYWAGGYTINTIAGLAFNTETCADLTTTMAITRYCTAGVGCSN